MKTKVALSKNTINTKYVDVLDGIRAFAILIIMAFHFWQQCWITPCFTIPIINKEISLYQFLATGYEYVDLMIFLSGFCLFLPHARAYFNGGNTDDAKTFYKKRIARIFPSYYFCVIALFIYNIATGAYTSTTHMWKDLISHLTFTMMFEHSTYTATLLNVVLWTISIEIMFYLIFPILAKAFKKSPVITYIVMVAVSLCYVHFYVLGAHADNIRLLVNSFPSFLSVFANGMAGALIFVYIAKKFKRTKAMGVICTIMSVAIILLINYLNTHSLGVAEDGQIWQIENRYWMSLLFGLLVIFTALGANWYRKIFANPVTVFLAGISMNLYIWHQYLAVFLKYTLKIPYWTGDTPPNQLGDTAWQWEYLIIITVVSFAVAIIMTYVLEKPCANLILKKKKIEKK